MATFWAWHYRSLVPFWRLHMEGRKKISGKKAVVMIANHRSLVDILALYKIRRHFKWTSKDENFKLPFVGMVLSLTNSIRIKRNSIRSGAQFIGQAETEMKKGSSILLFPEGTRSRGTKMRSFKEGAFTLAKRMNSPILPIVHSGTEKCFDRGSWAMKGRADIYIRVLDEIPAEVVAKTETGELMAMLREQMEQGLEELENRTAK